jgi:membrane associated rhomboid family serine protease
MIPLGPVARVPAFPWMTYLLIVANVVAFLAELRSPDPDRFVAAFATIPYDIEHHIGLAAPSPPDPYLTLITAQFMHASWWHLGSNMLFLFVFGPMIEYLCGPIRYLVLYLVCGVIGNLAQVAIMPGSHVPSIGASGAIAGILGAYLVNFPINRINTLILIVVIPLFVRLPAMLIIGLWAVAQFFDGFGAVAGNTIASQGGGVAYFTHIGGFLAGVILIGLFSTPLGRSAHLQVSFVR